MPITHPCQQALESAWHSGDARTKDGHRLVGNASKLAVLSGGNGLEALGQMDKLVEMTHHN